jgi:membrane-bound inhibitor of C-type lysozyme
MTLAVSFKLGMTVKEAEKECPKPLLFLDVKATRDVNYACDDGKKTTVLVFDNGKLAGILDIGYFAKEHSF